MITATERAMSEDQRDPRITDYADLRGQSAVVARPHHWPDVKNLLDALANTPEGGRPA